MKNSTLLDNLSQREASITLEHILDNSKAASGGQRDVNFLRFLLDNGILVRTEASMKRSFLNFSEEYYHEKYKKLHLESDRHFLCRTAIQEEFKRFGIETLADIAAGDMNILRADGNYDLVTADFGTLIDIGLTPARNYFRGLTDLKVRNFLITTYFDDYMDDIVFAVFSRKDDQGFLEAIKDYQEGFKQYISVNPDIPQTEHIPPQREV